MSSVIRPRTCRQCGAVFDGGPRAWYCPACRKLRKKEAEDRFAAKGRVAERPLGSIDHCVRCGKEYIVKGARQKYCPECAYEGAREADRPASRAWNQAHKDTYYPERKAKLRAQRAADPEPIRAKERERKARRKRREIGLPPRDPALDYIETIYVDGLPRKRVTRTMDGAMVYLGVYDYDDLALEAAHKAVQCTTLEELYQLHDSLFPEDGGKQPKRRGAKSLVSPYKIKSSGQIRYRVSKRIDNKSVHFGYYVSKEEAEAVAEKVSACHTRTEAEALRESLGIITKRRHSGIFKSYVAYDKNPKKYIVNYYFGGKYRYFGRYDDKSLASEVAAKVEACNAQEELIALRQSLGIRIFNKRERPVDIWITHQNGKTFYQPTYYLGENPIYLGRYLTEAEAEAVAERGRACKTPEEVEALRAELGIRKFERKKK